MDGVVSSDILLFHKPPQEVEHGDIQADTCAFRKLVPLELGKAGDDGDMAWT